MSAAVSGAAVFDDREGVARLRLVGDWTLAHHAVLLGQVNGLRSRIDARVMVDASELRVLDTAGAALLLRLLGGEGVHKLVDSDSGLSEGGRALLAAVGDAMVGRGAAPAARKGSAIGDVLAHIGEGVGTFWRHAVDLLGFVGLTLSAMLRVGLRPSRWRLTSLVANLEQTGLHAVPIVALLTFLVGAVVAFLGATVLADFGASVFTVNLVAFSFLREFGVLLTAILVAGRTASAYTAQIGSMRANEEVDAIRALGLDPVELLVLPRMWALLFALPMLTFIAMISGILGGMLVCVLSLGIPVPMFMSIIANDVGVSHFIVGMAKAPIFAFLIALIGCMEGFKVEGSAQSVGTHTTSSVVQSIFVVILVNAIAAMICMEMGW